MVGWRAVHPIAGDANALVAVANPVVAADEEVAVLLEGGMKGDAVGQRLPEVVQDLVGAVNPGLRWSGTGAASAFPGSWSMNHNLRLPGSFTTTTGLVNESLGNTRTTR